ncbi:MAG: hypothetical protein ACLS4Z_10815 [Christensenellaceae bacterium]
MKAQDGEKPREYAGEYFSVPVLFDESREYEAADMENGASPGNRVPCFLEYFDFSLLQSGYGEEFLREIVSRELAE